MATKPAEPHKPEAPVVPPTPAKPATTKPFYPLGEGSEPTN